MYVISGFVAAEEDSTKVKVKRFWNFKAERDEIVSGQWSVGVVSHTVQEWLEIKIYCLWLFSTFHIHTWWGQYKYVWKFEISRANFEKSQNMYILKIFLWILCINMQNGSNSKELRHK